MDDDDPLGRYRDVVDRAAQAGQTCALYLEKAGIGQPDEACDGPVLVVASYRVGDLAFTDRVLHPATEDVNREIRSREIDDTLDRFSAARRRLTEGIGPLADLEADE